MICALTYLAWRASIVVLAAWLDPAATVDVLLDDAYYYLQVAYNLGLHGRSTFDGITETNGYQPAWMALIAATEAVLRLDKKGLFVALQVLMWLTMALPLGFCLRRMRDPYYLALAAGLTVSYACFPGIYAAGLETVLFGPAFVALAHAARAGLVASARKAAWVFAAAVLIRLDAVSLLVAYALPLGVYWYREAGFAFARRRLFAFVLPSAVSLGVYGLGNYLVFGSPVPLSGVAKAVGAVPFSNWGILYNYLLQAIPVVMTFALVLVVELSWGKFEGPRWPYQGIAILGGSLLFHYAYYAAFSGWIPWPWYFYAYALMVALLIARIVLIASALAAGGSEVSLAGRVVPLAFVSLLGLGVPLLTHVVLIAQIAENQRRRGVPEGSFNRRNMADVQRFERDAQPLTVAIGDRAAGLGYWAPEDVHVFALEGLVSDKAYLEARRDDRGERWVAENIKPDVLVVDREQLVPVRIGDTERYVVIEPIQGRVVLDHLMAFCFPKDAVIRRVDGRDDQALVLPAPATRVTFAFDKRVPCSGAYADLVRDTVLSPESLRRSAVGAEYADFMAGGFNAALERFDRTLALKMRGLVAGAAANGTER